MGSSSLSLRSSSSQQRFHIFFADGGADGEEAWAEGGGDAEWWDMTATCLRAALFERWSNWLLACHGFADTGTVEQGGFTQWMDQGSGRRG